MSDGGRPSIVLRAPIHFVTQDGQPVHAPMVLATVGAIRTRLILDTGSDVHLLTREVAEAAGLALHAIDSGTDHSGTVMDSWLLGDVPVTFDEAADATGAAGAPLTLAGVVAIPAPDAFTRHGIGGGLSPQRLHGSAWAVIDQVDDELVLAEADAASLAAWLGERHPGADVLRIQRRPGIDLPIVQVAVEPHAPVAVLVNTGGRHTEFEPGTVPGVGAGELERIGTGVSGAAVMGARAGRQALAVGGRHVPVEDLMLRTGIGDPPAMIGQDVLRGTVVAVAPDAGRPVLWQVARLDGADPEARGPAS